MLDATVVPKWSIYVVRKLIVMFYQALLNTADKIENGKSCFSQLYLQLNVGI